ncbi:transcription factor Vhr1-domain-containing protein [Scheffersomyces amazonensis]|uniref:transcription factor Vhr1-domain-containing protein n=1 Tax=Scheffersomyces amazonensis TaxID=1078765 RepID=UPI00315D796B
MTNTNSGDNPKKLGVTHSIREKLHFQDDRLWKRFSARRLELIDTLDLCSKKASEQEEEIKKVAQALRLEFNYQSEYEQEFDKLVRAAVQSVRRNRKRSSKSKKGYDFKRIKVEDQHESEEDDNETVSDNTYRKKFISEISRLNSDSNDDVYDMNYSRTKNFSSDDKAKAAIDSMIKPRIQSSHPSSNHIQTLDANAAKGIIINHIERSKTCSESVSKKSENLQVLGKLIISTCISYIFEKSFENVNETSIEYLRNKLSGDLYLARFFRDLDPNTITSVSDEVAIISLYTLLGGVIKDFGFENIMFPLCEIIYVSILQEYPLIAKNSVPFKYSDYLNKSNDSNSLNSLATIATEMQQEQQHQQQLLMILLRFINQTLEFTFSSRNSAPPRFIEIIENARQAFNLKHDVILGIKNSKSGIIIQNDFDLERLFKMSSEQHIELEIFTQRSKAIPIYEITSAIIPNRNTPPPPASQTSSNNNISGSGTPGTQEKFILPPPLVGSHHHLNHGIPPPPLRVSPVGPIHTHSFNFLSNDDRTPPPPPVPLLPRFQPLL